MRTVVVSRALCLPLVFMVACAPKTVAPLPTVSSPRFPDFVAPIVPLAFTNTPAAESESRGWAFLQAGDLKNAEREFSAALKIMPAFYSAEAALGYVELARNDPTAALAHFGRTLERDQADTAALVGRGQANLALNREGEALAAFEAAVAADASLTEIKQRVEVLKFRGIEQGLADARAAARGGRLDEAIRAYTTAIASSPDSPFLYRELAAVERQKHDASSALDHFRRAVELDPTDASSLTEIGELLEARGDFEGAEKAYADALAIEPSAKLEGKLEAIRARVETAKLPAQYRAIDDLAQITRGDLAALIGVRLAPLVQPERRRDAVLITDVRTHWAATWILTVARADVMEPFANHSFQPNTAVRRTDLAQAVGRLLPRIAALKPAKARAWESARLRFTDLAPGHIAYPAASMAVASGVLTVAPDGSFQPSKVVSGAEAVEAIRRLEALAELPSPGQGPR